MKRKLLYGLSIGLGISLLLSVFLFLGLFKSWQNRLADSLFQERKPNPDIVIIAIDDKSIQEIGRWPWDRWFHAKLLNIISRGDPASIGVDISFFEPSASDNKLVDSIPILGNVTFAAEIEGSKVLKPLPSLLKNADFGIVNTFSDPDGITRKARVVFDTKEGAIQSFSWQVFETYLTKTQKESSFLEKDFPFEDGFMNINFIGKPGSFPTYSYVDVLTFRVNPNKFKDKIVLIGATAPDLHDDQVVPTSAGKPMPGVEIHANIIQTILEGKYLLNESGWQTLATVGIFSIVLSIIYVAVGIVPTIIIFISVFVAYIFYVIFSFDHGVIRSTIYPPLAIVLSTVSNIVYNYFSESRQKQFIKKAFSYYLSGSVMKEILKDPKKLKLGGERREITVLFSDVASFTTISEALDPATLANILNLYLSRMTNIVFKYDGVLDKYIGDAVMAFWGAPITNPNHALVACQTALEMYEEVKNFRKEIAKLVPFSKKIPELKNFDIRIGVNSGDMVVGNMGSDIRFDYTLLGDNVNLGSRLEGINKQYGTNIIISEATFEEVKTKVVVRKLDRVAVKGKKKGITIYELRSMGNSNKKEKKFLEEFENARILYEKGQFKKALQSFKVLAKEYPDDNPTKIYIERCEELTKHSPKSWDGIFHAMTK